MRQPVLVLSAVLAALLVALAATSVLVQPPEVRESSSPGQFDAARAKARLAVVLGDERPHPSDSIGNDAVRTRLLGQIRALGLTPIIRDQFACNEIYKQRGVTCARVRNILLPLGPAEGKALLLNTHYDSNPSGPGAGDAGVGVATMLEVASIIRNERLERPVILLFNEGEELGLVGARAFLADPASQRVDTLINLEARGVSGPVSMFETSLPNGPPVRAFARAVDRPFANSLATDFYRQLPNYTDVNSFSEKGWATLNFAMIGNETRYHSAGDSLAALDERSLQHMGDQTLAATRELSRAAPTGDGTLLFADVAGRWLLVIPGWAGIALLAGLAAGYAVLSWRLGGLWRGLATAATALAGSAALAWAALFLMGELRPGSYWRAYPAWTHLAVYACGLLAAVATLALLARKLSAEQLRASFWLFFLLLGLAVLLIAPGGIIYFVLPPLAAIAGLLLSGRFGWAARAGAVTAAVLLWLTFGEVVALLGQLMVNGPMVAFAPLAALIAMPWLIEARPLIDKAGRLGAIGSAAILTLAGWAAVAAAPAYSEDRQQRFTIQHVTDMADGRAYWSVTNDGAPLPSRFGNTSGWEWAALPYGERKRWVAPAPREAATTAPAIHLLGVTTGAGTRTVRFRIENNGADSVSLMGPEDAEILSAGSGDYVRPIASGTKGEYALTCFGRSCAGAEMEFTTRQGKPLEFTLVGMRRSLAEGAKPLIAQRPRFARTQYTPDSTLTLSRIRL